MGRVRIENESERGVAGRKGGNKRGVAGVILGEAQGQRGAHIAAPTGPAEESWPLLCSAAGPSPEAGETDSDWQRGGRGAPQLPCTPTHCTPSLNPPPPARAGPSPQCRPAPPARLRRRGGSLNGGSALPAAPAAAALLSAPSTAANDTLGILTPI